MQLIYSLLLKDFYIKSDLISSFNTFPDDIYKYHDNIILLQNINNKEISIKNLLSIIHDNFYSLLNDTINSKKNKFFNINFDSSNMFNLLNLPSDHTNDIISKINMFYKEFNIPSNEINSENFLYELDKELNVSEYVSLTEYLKLKINETIKEQNLKIFEEILYQYNNIVSNIDCTNNDDLNKLFEYFQYRLFIFFKIVGKDFISFINKPITDKDVITTVLFKYNKEFFFKIRFELINFWYYKENNMFNNLTTQEIFFMIFLLTYRDKHLTLLDSFSIEYIHNEKKYSDKSISIHRLYHYK